jgi:hypothetical protein
MVVKFKSGWDIPSNDLAYFIGVIASDGSINEYQFSINSCDIEYMFEVARILRDVFGLSASRSDYVSSSGKLTYRLWSCGKVFVESFGSERDKMYKFVKRDGEWVDFINEKFSWVWGDGFFWSFMSGLFDGDGCLSWHNMKRNILRGGSVVGVKEFKYPIASIAIYPNKSKEKIFGELKKRGFKTRIEKYQIVILGGRLETERFMSNLKCVLSRKRLEK